MAAEEDSSFESDPLAGVLQSPASPNKSAANFGMLYASTGHVVPSTVVTRPVEDSRAVAAVHSSDSDGMRSDDAAGEPTQTRAGAPLVASSSDSDTAESRVRIPKLGFGPRTPRITVSVDVLEQKSGSGLGKHTSYVVRSSWASAASGAEPQVAEVSRRYSDFVWLYEDLVRAFPFRTVPVLPEKKMFGRFDDATIGSRRRGLEQFLVFVAAHPVLAGSASLRTFLTTAGQKDFAKWASTAGAECVDGEESCSSALFGDSLLARFLASVDYSGRLLRFEELIDSLGACLAAANEALMHRREALAQQNADLRALARTMAAAAQGLRTSSHATASNTSDALMRGISHWGRGVDADADGHTARALADLDEMDTTLEFYAALCQGASNALKARARALRDKAAGERALRDAQAKKGADTSKLAALEAKLASASQACDFSVGALLQEFARLRKHRKVLLAALLDRLIDGVVPHSEAVRASWRRTYRKLHTSVVGI